jgi:hypothetical protein
LRLLDQNSGPWPTRILFQSLKRLQAKSTSALTSGIISEIGSKRSTLHNHGNSSRYRMNNGDQWEHLLDSSSVFRLVYLHPCKTHRHLVELRNDGPEDILLGSRLHKRPNDFPEGMHRGNQRKKEIAAQESQENRGRYNHLKDTLHRENLLHREIIHLEILQAEIRRPHDKNTTIHKKAAFPDHLHLLHPRRSNETQIQGDYVMYLVVRSFMNGKNHSTLWSFSCQNQRTST